MLSYTKLSRLSRGPLQLVARILLIRSQLLQDSGVCAQPRSGFGSYNSGGNFPSTGFDIHGMAESRDGRLLSGVRCLTSAWPEHFISLSNLADNPGATKTVRARCCEANTAKDEYGRSTFPDMYF